MTRSKIARARRIAHRTEVALGDVRAVQRGRIGQRVANRVLGRIVGRGLRGLWR